MSDPTTQDVLPSALQVQVTVQPPALAVSPAPVVAPLIAPAVVHDITLEQFGIELSRSDKRVELLNAFIFMERQARHFKDTKANYHARFLAFIDQPVARG